MGFLEVTSWECLHSERRPGTKQRMWKLVRLPPPSAGDVGSYLRTWTGFMLSVGEQAYPRRTMHL